MEVCNEPPSGWNLPPGCTEADVDRAFGDPEAWRRSTCGDCRHCYLVECAVVDDHVCLSDPLAPMAVRPESPACEEGFEEC